MLSRSLLLAAAAAAAPLTAGAQAASAPTDPPIGGMPAIGGRPGLAILRPCAASQLKAAVARNEVASMHRELRITLTNTGATACAIDGYPAIRLLDELKHPRITAESFSQKPRLFTIAHNQQAAFRLRVAIGDGTTPFMTAPTLAVIPPGDVAPLLLNVQLPVAPTIGVTAVLRAAELK